jgi:N-acetyl-anhydromuramyl-L-alanine amidase AmpD
MDIGADEIRSWHVNKNGWSDIGYHYVIRRSGVIDTGRPLKNSGAHVKGRNATTVGVCLVGGEHRSKGEQFPDSNFTYEQYNALRKLIAQLRGAYPSIVKVSGHRDYDPHKACPCFDTQALEEK